MMGYRIGDKTVLIKGVPTRLRLSVSALAEITQLTQSDSPAALAQQLRRAGKEADIELWGLILNALATPRPKGTIEASELTKILPDIAAVISEGLVS